jgi:hypothetical protein
VSPVELGLDELGDVDAVDDQKSRTMKVAPRNSSFLPSSW